MADLFRILSIDGGGIRGIIPASVLIRVEQKLQEEKGDPNARIADYFDLVAGTSTGGILTCVYLCPSPAGGRPRFTAQEALDLYVEHGDEIFDIPLWHKIASVGGTVDEKYPAAELEEVLDDYLGDLKLDLLLKPCLITAYDIKRRRAHFFKQHRATGEADRNFFVRDVARATSAAPTFFECARIKSDANLTYPLVDGGVFANNPTLCAYAEARARFGKTAAQMAILSLGTGSYKKSYAYSEAKDWGPAGWAKPVIDIMMSGLSETVDFQLGQVYQAVGEPEQYLRIQPEIPAANADMDNAEQDNLAELREAGVQAALDKDTELTAFVQLLVKGT